jgi:hypothetical protein
MQWNPGVQAPAIPAGEEPPGSSANDWFV